MADLKSRFQAVCVGPESPLFAHFTASVFIGSTLSHFRQRNSVLPVRSVIAIKSFLHFGQRYSFMTSSRVLEKSRSGKPNGECLLSLKNTGKVEAVGHPTRERIQVEALEYRCFFPRLHPRARRVIPECGKTVLSPAAEDSGPSFGLR
jgi:hypothetical protein